MSDFKMKGGKLVKYEGEAVNVKISEGVTEIGKDAFKGCTCTVTYKGKKYAAG